LGTCWIGAFDQQAVKNLLGVPDEATVVALLALGHPTLWPTARSRKPLEEIVCYERWNA
jgi:nitroreductase